MEVAQFEKLSFFEVQRTPPDEKRKREKAAEEAAKEKVEILLLTPFASRPTVEFERVKLGKSGVRKLLIRNPGDKPLDVLLNKLPKDDKGFNVDYVAFTLGGKEETSLLIGWTPIKVGGVRENIIVKFGGKFSAQIVLIGSCIDPDTKKILAVNTARPLGPSNRNPKQGSKTRPSVPSSKLNAAATPKMAIPVNPVVRQDGSPPKRVFNDIANQVDNEVSKPMQPPAPVPASNSKFVCGTNFNPAEFSKADNFVSQCPRRETYVQERPTPSCGDIVESTPILKREFHKKENASEVAETFDTRLSNIMPPPNQEIRRQTFVSGKLALPTVTDSSNDEDDVDFRRQTFVKLPQAPVVNHRETYVKLPQAPPAPTPAFVPVQEEVQESEAPVNLSIAPLNLSSKPKALSDLLDQLNDVESEPLDLSFPSEIKPKSDISPKEKKNITLNISESNLIPAPQRYCPRVSDISLPESPPPRSPAFPMKASLKQPSSLTPLKDPRLSQLLGGMNISGCGNLDLSIGSQFGNCSLAVNLNSPGRNRDNDFEDEELAEIEENKENYDEEELELIAVARGTSALGQRSASSSYTEKSPRLSTGTIVKTAPTLHHELLPSVKEDINVEYGKVEVAIEEEVVETREVVHEEIEEEVIELEFEITSQGEKRLIGEKSSGKTLLKEVASICQTPITQRREAQCDISRMIEQHLSNAVSDQVKPRAVMLTEDQEDNFPKPVFSISHHQAINIDKLNTESVMAPTENLTTTLQQNGICEETQVNAQDNVAASDTLPGLKGSPRISNQMSKHPDNFLCVTVNETSFLPPSPDDPRRCSTGVKNKENMQSKTPSPNAFVRKSLFSVKPSSSPPDTIKLNSQGFVLPVIDSDDNNKQDKSTDTYIAGPESPRLSTIQEEDTISKSSACVASITTETTLSIKSGEEKAPVQETEVASTKTLLNKSNEKKILKARRSMVTYNSRKIETLAKPRKSLDSFKKSSPETEKSNGLMFISMTPGGNEKRKPETGQSKSEVTKRTKTVLPLSKTASRPTVRAVKNPVLQKSAEVSKVKETKTTTKPLTKSVPSRQPISRLVSATKKLSLNKPTKTIVHHPNPFASRNMYYDEKWVEKQERGFSKWLNFFLTPQLLDEGESSLPKSIDIAHLWSQCSRDVKEPRAPTKEQMSLRQYTVRTELNRLRKRACRIWQSKDVASVIRKVELEIEKLRLVVRKDRNITKDVGMKQSLLKLILSYNPLWLRIGLETIYGEILPLGNNADLLGLSRFLITRWLSNPDILSEYAHPSVPHSYRDGCQDALNKFALKKFLELVFFLDIAKESKLIRHNPCLFCPDSQHKTSREVLLIFAKDYLAGEGDITKHLAYMNYIVRHKQTKLDEFDFAVTNIKTDLRCGVRLAKVAELLLAGCSDVMSQLRVPSISRLQKVHNVDLALTALRKGGAEIRKDIVGKDLVDGHREKTLELLWSIIFGYQLATILNLDNIREEIDHLRSSLAAKARLGNTSAKSGIVWLKSLLDRSPSHTVLAGERLELLLEWVRLVMIHYGVEIDNWTTSWCDGRALCLLVYHYQPSLLDKAEIRQQTTITHQANNQNLDDSADFSYGTKNLDPKVYESLVENERANFRLLLQRVSMLGGVPVLITPGDMSNTIPDEKVTATFIGYLAVRLLDLSREIKAARVIQLAWRKYYAIKKEEQLKVKFAS